MWRNGFIIGFRQASESGVCRALVKYTRCVFGDMLEDTYLKVMANACEGIAALSLWLMTKCMWWIITAIAIKHTRIVVLRKFN